MSKEIDLQVGDLVTFSNTKQELVVDDDDRNFILADRANEIVTIERPAYRTAFKMKKSILNASVLDAAEKEYLGNLIAPFRDKVKSIRKSNSYNVFDGREFIGIYLESILHGQEKINLPYFYKGTMYKNMKPGKGYTVEELGL